MKKIFLSILTILLVGTAYRSVFAVDVQAPVKLPETMVGQTTVNYQHTVNSAEKNLYFDGKADRITVPSTFHTMYTGLDFTIMFNLRMSDQTTNYRAIFKDGGRNFTYDKSMNTLGWAIGALDTRLVFSFGNGTNVVGHNGNQLKSDVGFLEFDDKWHNYAITRNASTNQVRIYKDAIEKSITNSAVEQVLNPTGSVNPNSSSTLIIGGDGTNDTKYFIEKVRFYDQVLTAGDISNSIGSSPPSIGYLNLKGAWEMSEGKGTQIVNKASTNIPRNDGTLTDSSDWVPKTTSLVTDSTYYGGFTGNEAVYNYTDNTGQTIGKKLAPYMNFDGTDDFIKVGNRPELNFSGKQSFSISAWIKPTGDSGQIVSKYKYNSNGQYSLYISASGRITFHREGPGAAMNGYAQDWGVTSTTIAETGKWSHVVGVAESSTCGAVPCVKLNVYINGVKDPAVIYQSGDIGMGIDCKADFMIGNRDDDAQVADLKFKGGIDEVKIYKRALSGAEISDQYQGKSIPSTNLIGSWDFSEGSGAVAIDRSTSGFDGSLQNFNTNSGYSATDGPEAFDSGKTSLAPSLSFDGVDDYVDTEKDIGDNTSTLTVTAWIKNERDGYAKSWVAKDDATSSRSWFFGLNGTPGEFRVALWTGTGVRGSDLTMGGLPFDTWTHVAFVYNGSNVVLYKNGAAGTSVAKSGKVADNGQHVTIGEIPIGTACDAVGLCNFQGGIDDVRIYHRALSSTEINNVYKGETVDATDLKGEWEFSEGSGGTTVSSANGTGTATLKNMTNSDLSGWRNDGPPVTKKINRDDGYDLFGFNQDTLANCITGSILGTANRCFVPNTRNSSIKVMSSRTFVNSGTDKTPVMELAALYYSPRSTIVGDAYLGSSGLSDFSYWGRHLTQTKGGAGAGENGTFWGSTGYVLNPNAKANLIGSEFAKNQTKIDTLKGEAPKLNIATLQAGGSWFLQSETTPNQLESVLSDNTPIDNIDGSKVYGKDAKNMPEGKIWLADRDLNITKDVTYTGSGTIIVNGNLTIDYGVDIGPALAGINRLGFIVTGDVIFRSGLNNIDAAIYAYNNISVGNNSNFVGSFVAKSFLNLDLADNVRFYYNTAFNQAWPPGFGYLNMPKPNS